MCAVAGGMARAVVPWFISLCVGVCVRARVGVCVCAFMCARTCFMVNKQLFSAKVSQLLIRSLLVTLQWQFGRDESQ